MRPTPFVLHLALAAAAILAAAPAYAQKGKPGGGTTPPPPPVRYTAQLFTVPNNSIGNIGDANDLGQAVGWSPMPDGSRHAWYYDPALDPGAAIDLTAAGVQGVPEGWTIASAVGLNNRGDFVGYLTPAAGGDARRGYVIDVSYDPAVPSRLYLLPDAGSTYAYGRRINDAGDVLGVYRRLDGTWGAYLFHTGLYDGTPDADVTDLGVTLDPRLLVELNGFGQVAGLLADNLAFRFTPGLGVETFPALTPAYVYGLNDLGTLCGMTEVTTQISKNRTAKKLVPYRVGAAVELLTHVPMNYEAAEINDSGDLLIDFRHLYRDDWVVVNGTGLVDVLSLVTTPTGASSMDLDHMTERRPAVGYGDFVGTARMPDGTRRGLLLTAVPAP